MVDLNGNGLLSSTEFMMGLQALRIPWKELTGLDDVNELFQMFDTDNSGEVDLEEFLGYPNALEADWRTLDEQGAWRNYITKVKMTTTKMTRAAKWERVMMDYTKKALEKQRAAGDPEAARVKLRSEILQHGVEHPEVKKYRIGMLDDVEIMRVRRMQQTQLDDQRRKMDHAMKDLQEYRREFARMQRDLTDVAAEDEKQKAREEAAERERQQRSQGIGLEKPGGGGRRCLDSRPPPEELLVSWFNETSPDLELDEGELKIREIARDLDIPIPEVEKVKAVFDKYDEDGSGQMEKEEFDMMMTDLICVGRLKGLEVPPGLLNEQWKQVDHDGSGEVDFDEFAEWYCLSYIPKKMADEERSRAMRAEIAEQKRAEKAGQQM